MVIIIPRRRKSGKNTIVPGGTIPYTKDRIMNKIKEIEKLTAPLPRLASGMTSLGK